MMNFVVFICSDMFFFILVKDKKETHQKKKMSTAQEKKFKTIRAETKLEWEKVKNEPSLCRYYETRREYQKWRNRFISAGFITKNAAKKPAVSKAAYNRIYYKGWRLRNKEKVKQYSRDYWFRKLTAEGVL
jgi:hypothetical protein